MTEETKSTNISTKILQCSCANEYQDKRYGKGKRVANAVDGGKAKKSGIWRCVVCGREHTA